MRRHRIDVGGNAVCRPVQNDFVIRKDQAEINFIIIVYSARPLIQDLTFRYAGHKTFRRLLAAAAGGEPETHWSPSGSSPPAAGVAGQGVSMISYFFVCSL